MKFCDYLLLIFIAISIYIAESFWVGILWVFLVYFAFNLLIEIMFPSNKENKKSKKKKITERSDTINIKLDD